MDNLLVYKFIFKNFIDLDNHLNPYINLVYFDIENSNKIEEYINKIIKNIEYKQINIKNYMNDIFIYLNNEKNIGKKLKEYINKILINKEILGNFDNELLHFDMNFYDETFYYENIVASFNISFSDNFLWYIYENKNYISFKYIYTNDFDYDDEKIYIFILKTLDGNEYEIKINEYDLDFDNISLTKCQDYLIEKLKLYFNIFKNEKIKICNNVILYHL